MEKKKIKFESFDEKADFLTDICTPLIDYLKQNHNPHTEIVISENQIRVVSAEIGIPLKGKGD